MGDFFFRAETAACPGGGPPPTQEYYDCLSERMWTRHPILLDALGGIVTPGGAVTIALVTLVVVGCLVRFRSEAADAAQYAPRPLSTAGIVRAMIETSDQIDQFSM